MIAYWFRLAGVLALLASLPAQAVDRVVLQLKWEHEFQFAGYYAAQWLGYYADAGLEVEIRSGFDARGHEVDVQHTLLAGEADFAIGGVDILLAKDRALPFVILAPIFQKSPGALVTLAEHKLRSLRDLSGLRVAVSKNDYITHELKALLGTRLNNGPPPILVDEPLTLDTLLDDRADVLLTYGVSAQRSATEKGVAIRLLNIADVEPTFYGDTLYTHRDVITRSPEVVRRFTEASLRGWSYAMAHPEEFIDRIAALPRRVVRYDDPRAYNAAFAEKAREYLFYPYVELGLSDVERWRRSHDLLKAAGIAQGVFTESELFFLSSQDREKDGRRPLYIVIGVCALLLLTLIVAMVLPVRVSAPLLLAGVLATGLWGLESQLKSQFLEAERRDVWTRLVGYRLELEAAINRNFAMLRGVVGMVASEPTLDQRRFSGFASTLIDLEPLLINFAAAPDLVVKYVYPELGNERILGVDYRTLSDQFPMVELTRDSRRMVVAGPLELIQGGRAIIGRAPVFLTDDDVAGAETFWGIVSAPMDFDGLIDDVGLNAPNLPIAVSLRRGHLSIDGQDRQAFFGSDQVFSSEPVTMSISLGATQWELGAVPIAGWEQFPLWLQWLKLLGMLAISALSAGLYATIREFQTRVEIDGQFRRNEGILRRVGRIADVGGWELDLATGQEFVTEEVYLLHGMSPTPLIDERSQRWLDYYDEPNRKLVLQRLDDAIGSGEPQSFELLVTERGREHVWLRHMIEPVFEAGQIVKLQGVVQDISAIRRADATIQRQAMFDPVTGLPNRNLFTQRLKQALDSSYRTNARMAVLFIDLDHFKDVNDSLGHSAGDKLLFEVGQRMRSALRGTDTVARLGGDEFTILLDGIKNARHCELIVQKVSAALQGAVKIDDHQVYTSASIGVSLYPEDGRSVTALLQHADQAMYAAKNAGRNTARFFTASMQQEVDRRHALHTRLAEALDKEELEVYYQPIIDTRTGKIAKCEALLRWAGISPEEFIPVAEETGMISAIGEYVLRRSCEDIHYVNEKADVQLTLAYNKSTREFVEEQRLHISVLDTLKQQALFPDIIVEITENLLMQEGEETVAQLQALRDAGVKVAIDDFGTGYSSLSYLRKFPVDYVKIDRTFIQEIEQDSDSRALVKAIISMAHSLNIEVVAEGVETVGQFTLLEQWGCEYVQGFYFSPALQREAFIRYVTECDRVTT